VVFLEAGRGEENSAQILEARQALHKGNAGEMGLKKLKTLDLFSGIGGFSLGLERTGGFETVAFCEIDKFCKKVLAKHWPNVRQYEDVKELTADTLARDGIAVDVITGGFPCQDISVAGKRAGISDGTRSGLWSEIVRLAGELRPKYIIVENVANLLSGPADKRGGWFGRVLGDLAEIGYDAEWHCIPASAVGAPHGRDRIWIVAYTNCWDGEPVEGERPGIWSAVSCEGANTNACGAGAEQKAMADTTGIICDGGGVEKHYKKRGVQFAFGGGRCDWRRIGEFWSIEPDVGRVADGVPARAHRLKALGNAVVPQIPEMIGRAILESMKW